MMLQEVARIAVIGLGISSVFFWILITLRTTDPKRSFTTWLKIFVPQGILIALALKYLEII